jgi:hypothetical protein
MEVLKMKKYVCNPVDAKRQVQVKRPKGEVS